MCLTSPLSPAETKPTLQVPGSLPRRPPQDLVGGVEHPGSWGDGALACRHPTSRLSSGASKHPATQPRGGQTPPPAAA